MTAILAVAMISCGNDAGTSNRSSSDQTADEALESLNEEINAMIEAEQREAEEQAQRAEEGYPEGVIPEGEYRCQDILDDESDENYFNPGTLSFFNGDVFMDYTYDSETQRYTIVWSPQTGRYQNFTHQFEGTLNEEGNLIIDRYERSTWRDDNSKWEISLEDIEWVYVLQE